MGQSVLQRGSSTDQALSNINYADKLAILRRQALDEVLEILPADRILWVIPCIDVGPI